MKQFEGMYPGMTATVVQLKKKQETQFICSACGAERGCDCNAPAVEKLAEKLEQDRQRAKRAYKKKKDQQNQSSSHVRNADDEIPSEEEADESWQEALYDQACLLLERMADSTRQKLFAHIRKTYHHED